MSKKTIIILFIGAIMLLSFTWLGRAQNDAEVQVAVEEMLNQVTAALAKLEAKIDNLSAKQENIANANKEVLQKIDQVLTNQDAIIKELGVVRVRASRPR